jgi:ATP-dependent DNA helicase RecG
VIGLTWFNQPWIARKLQTYRGEIVAYGLVKEANLLLEIASPEYELLDEDADHEDFARIVPVYPLTEGVHQKTVRRAVRNALEIYLPLVQDPLPESFRKRHSLPPLAWCLKQVHEPESDDAREKARTRLVFEEFLYLQLQLAMARAQTQQEIGISFPISSLEKGEDHATRRAEQTVRDATGKSSSVLAEEPNPFEAHLFEQEEVAKRSGVPLWDQIHAMLPFELTRAQRRVIQELFRDMERPAPMNRLVQGDVGSGKTAVAACAMLAAVRSGYQAALMAPTEILAEQHYVNLRRLFEPLGIEVVLLVGKQSKKERDLALRKTADGTAKIAVGTHALIQEGVSFRHLGFVVIDEQHRFGVLQRAALRDKGLGNPDVLVMTATPIPRTLTMTLYGDLDVSVIDELPPGRKPVKTHWKKPYERSAVYEAIQKLLREGRQAYVVCPIISENEKVSAQAAEDLHDRLQSGVLKDWRVGLLHGQMKASEKEKRMLEFRAHEIDVLVSTSVIEVGVDVPNASVMVIEDANRFGLSQLHQLRGRVGRGEHQSYCILIADARTDDAIARMEIMRETSDGFKIAEEDLRLRGPGELVGTRQSGNLDLKIADLVRDAKQLERAREAAIELIREDPELAAPAHAGMLEKVRQRREKAALITVS